MFLGRYNHNIDEKGRLTIPARYRDVLAAEGAYVTQGFDQNLIVLTESAYEAITQRVSQMSVTDPNARLLRRLFFSTTDRAEIDRAGRILIPSFLRQFAELDGEAVIVGMGDYFEIWSPGIWTNQAQQLEDSEANSQRFTSFQISTS